MPCSGHRNAVTSERCASCGTPGCPECLEPVEGLYYCTSCLLLKLQEAETEASDLETGAAVRHVQLEAKRRIRRNWILTGIVSIVGAPAAASLVIDDDAIPAVLKVLAAPAAGIVAVYLVWAALWGVPAAWRWWKGALEGFSAFIFSSALGWIVLAVSFLIIPIYLGHLYGVFGGAINEYKKNRQIATGGSLVMSVRRYQ